MKKKILFKLWQFPHLSETFIIAQIITALKCGFDVKILVGELLDYQESMLHRTIEEYDIAEKIILENYKVPKNRWIRICKSIPLLLYNIIDIKFLFNYILNHRNRGLENIYEFNFYRQFKNYDIIHVQYGTNARPVDLLKKIHFLNCKLVVSFHGHDAFFPINGIIENKGYYDYLFESANYIVANTEYLANCILGLGCKENTLKIIPVGVDTEKFSPVYDSGPSPKSDYNLISVGRLDKVKGHLYAIEVLGKLKLKGYAVNLTIVGEGKERKGLEKLISKNQLKEQVILVGKKSQSEIRDLLRESDIYILAAVPVENNRRETQGLATLEAQACSLPVVAFDSGGVKYTIRNGISGYLVPEYDVDQMTKCIEQLINDREMRLKMGEEAVNFVKKEFSQNKIDEIWCETYQSLLNN